MSHTDKARQTMLTASPRRNHEGFSIVEMMVVITVMLIVVGAVFSLMRDSVKVATTTYELTDAQQNLRTAQELINRDLMNAGDGLESISNIRLPEPFVRSYITLNPVLDPSTPGIINLGIFTTDNNVPATAVTGAVPAATLRATTDRQTILELDPEFAATTPASINATGSTVTLHATYAMTQPDGSASFFVGEVYFLSAGTRATFATITGINSGARQLSFNTGDTYALNRTAVGGHIRTISADGTLPTSLQRMKIIQYYVTSTGLLVRRVFGVPRSGFRESIVAEHVLDVQFNYSLITADPVTGIVTPRASTSLTTSEDQLAVRQVEVTVTVETPHAIIISNVNGLPTQARQPMTMTTSTSVRNMQFRQAL